MARTRYEPGSGRIALRALPAAALRAVWREGYGGADLRADVLAGLVVGIVALPLAMALGIAVGVAPQNGLYTSIVAGVIVAALGGSRLQVTGPTAAFIVILAPIYAKFGLAGLLVSGLMGGLMLIAMGVAPPGPAHRVHPVPGHQWVHRGHRRRHRDVAAEGRAGPESRRCAGVLLRPDRGHVAGARNRACQ